MKTTRSTGPTSKAGKAKAAMNSIRHGLLGTFTVIGDERVQDYEASVEDWCRSFALSNSAQQRLCLLAADLVWRLERLTRLEHRHLHERLETALKESPQFKANGLAHRALVVVNELIRTVSDSAPVTGGPGLLAFAQIARQVVALVRDVEDLPIRVIGDFEVAVDAVQVLPTSTITVEAYVGVKTAAECVAAALISKVHGGNADLEKLRAVLGGTVLLIDDKEGRRLSRYRDQLQKALGKQLELVANVGNKRRSFKKSSSFGKVVRAPAWLKVVAGR